MKFSEASSGDGYFIRAYESGWVFIGEQGYQRSLVVMPDRIEPDWEPQTIADLRQEHIQFVAELAPEIIILGTGRNQIFPSWELLQPALKPGVGLEIMDTAAACRTYNILMAEGRQVAAAIMII